MDEASNPKIVAIHQPNYIPWLGYFSKIAACHEFVFHDNVEHSKRYPTRRTMIRKSVSDSTPVWLSVPLQKHSDFAFIRDLRVDMTTDWASRHLKKIGGVYGAYPHFEPIFTLLREIYDQVKRLDSLAEVNIHFIKQISAWLELNPAFHLSSELPCTGKASEYNIAMVKYLGGKVYLSGKGGGNYQDEADYLANQISLRYNKFTDTFRTVYPVRPINYSILDFMFEEGIEGTKKILQACSTK